MESDEVFREKAGRELHKNATRCIEQILEATSRETKNIMLPIYYIKNHPNKTNKACQDTAGETITKCSVMFAYGPLPIDVPMLDYQ